jgi:hypothetical protein
MSEDREAVLGVVEGPCLPDKTYMVVHFLPAARQLATLYRALERELAEARDKAEFMHREASEARSVSLRLTAELAEARGKMERLRGALAAANNDEDVCCHGVGFDQDCEDCETVATHYQQEQKT